jgi:hypothetical protein
MSVDRKVVRSFKSSALAPIRIDVPGAAALLSLLRLGHRTAAHVRLISRQASEAALKLCQLAWLVRIHRVHHLAPGLLFAHGGQLHVVLFAPGSAPPKSARSDLGRSTSHAALAAA